MITGRSADHTCFLFLRIQSGNQIDAATNLEGSDGLMIFMLDENFETQLRRQPRVMVQRRRLQITIDHAFGIENVGENRCAHHYIRAGTSMPMKSRAVVSVCRTNSTTER